MVSLIYISSLGVGPWSSSKWTSSDPGIMMFNTHKAPPDIAPTELRVKVKDKTIDVEWKNPEFIITQVDGYRVSKQNFYKR